MSKKELLLAIDNGTQSVKAILFDLEGRVVAEKQVTFNPYFSQQPGWAEQDPDVFWQCLCKVCQGLLHNGEVDKGKIAGVSLTTQRATVINVDRKGKPLRPAMLWLDQRKTYGLPFLGGLWGVLFRILGLTETIRYFQAEAEANWIRTNQPDVWEKTYKYLLLSGYLTYRLTGLYVDSTGSCVGYLPFDYKRLRWASDWDWKWRAVPMEREWLPKLVAPSCKLGVISPEAAGETGIPAGLPLIAAAADKACEVIGSGSLKPSIGCLSYGTTATVNVTNKKYQEAIPLLPAYPAAIPAHHSLEVQVFRGYWMVSWFKEQFGHPEIKEATIRGVEAEALFEQLVEGIPPGSMGLILQPYWSPGLKMPGPEAKGAVIGFGDIHTRAHLYRSILEGIAFALRDGKERIEKKTGVPVTELRVSGGGSQSRVAMQATADIFGLPTVRPTIYETSALGAAIDCAVGVGLHADFDQAVTAMTHTGDIFEPDPEVQKMYEAMYRSVYRKMYKKLKPLYRRIRKITGYPA